MGSREGTQMHGDERTATLPDQALPMPKSDISQKIAFAQFRSRCGQSRDNSATSLR
jgi:hypothetical protein